MSGLWADCERTHDGNTALHCSLLCSEDSVPHFYHWRKMWTQIRKPWKRRQNVPPKSRRQLATLHSATTQTTALWTATSWQLTFWCARLRYSENFFIRLFLISEASTRAISLPQISGLNKTVDLPTPAKQCVTDRRASYLKQKRAQCQFGKKLIWFSIWYDIFNCNRVDTWWQ